MAVRSLLFLFLKEGRLSRPKDGVLLPARMPPEGAHAILLNLRSARFFGTVTDGAGVQAAAKKSQNVFSQERFV